MPPRPRWSARDVGDHRDVVAVVAQALAQDPAAGDLEHRGVHGRVLEHGLGARGARDMSPFRMSRPSMTMPSVVVMPTRRPMSLRMWAIMRTVVVLPLVPVTPMIGMRAGVPGGNSRSMTGLATYCGSPSVGLVCIRKPGAALTSTMAPPCSRTGTPMSGTMKSMPAMSRPDDPGGRLRDLDVLRVGVHGPVDGRAAGGHVAGERELDAGPLRGTESIVQPCLVDELHGRLVELDAREHLLVAEAPARVGCSRCPPAPRRCARRRAVTPAGTRSAMATIRPPMTSTRWSAPVTIRLHDHVPAATLAQGDGERLAGRPSSERRSRHTPRPWLPSSGLTTTGKPMRARRSDRVLHLVHGLRSRHRQPGGREQLVGERLVGGDVDRDGGRPRGHRGADALLVPALPQLHQAVAVEPDPGDVARDRLVDDGLGRGPERRALRDADEPLQRAPAKSSVASASSGATRWLTSATAMRPASRPDLLLAVLEDDVVATGLAGGAGLADAHIGAREALQLERDVLRDVAHPGAVREAAEEAAPPAERAGVVLHRGQQRHERLVEARDGVRGVLLEHAQVDRHPDDRAADPDVGPAQDPGVEDAQASGRCGRRRRSSRPAGRRAPTGSGPRWPGLAGARRLRVRVASASAIRVRGSVSSTPGRPGRGRAAPARRRAPGDAGRSGSPPGSEWSTTLLIMIGRCARTSQASVSDAWPSTMVTLRRPMTSMTMSGLTTRRGVLVDAQAQQRRGSGRWSRAAGPSRLRCWKCWSTMTPGRMPRPAAIWTMRCLGVPPLAPKATMWLLIARRAGARARDHASRADGAPTIACARAVPPMVEDSRSWLPPVMNTPVESRTVRAASSSLAWARVVAWMGQTSRGAQLGEHLAIHLARERPQRRGAADDRDARVRPAGERDEAAQDEPLADLVLGAPDDDDVPFSHRLLSPSAVCSAAV